MKDSCGTGYVAGLAGIVHLYSHPGAVLENVQPGPVETTWTWYVENPAHAFIRVAGLGVGAGIGEDSGVDVA